MDDSDDPIRHRAHVIISPDRVIGAWWRKGGHALHPDDLEALFEAVPQVLVVRQGSSGRMQVAQKTRQAPRAAGIELVALPAQKAVETYNRLRERRAIVADRI